MARSDKLKIFVLIALAAVIAAVLLFSLPTGELLANKLLTDGEEVLLPNTVTLSSDGWEKFTFRNAPDFSETVFNEKDAYYYELPCSPETQYSITATLTSPALDVYAREYSLGVKYFTRQSRSIANEIAVYGSTDGADYTFADSYLCSDNGAETPSWRDASLTVKPFKYLRFVLTVFYGGEGAEHIANSGLYLAKEFTLTATPTAKLDQNDFSVSVIPDQVLTYNGSAQYPEYNVDADTDAPYYVRAYATESACPINADDYTLRVEIYDDANALVTFSEFPYRIQPQEIELTDYTAVSNEDYAVILDATFTDKAGRTVSLSEAGCERILPTNGGVTISVNNANFLPYETVLEDLEPDSSAGYVYYIENKNVTVTYDGTPKDISDALTVFSSYDFATGTFTEASAWLKITYTLNGEEVTPTNAGEYEYSVEYGSSVYRGTLTVLPIVITEAIYTGEYSLDKYYDGMTSVGENGLIVRTLDSLSPCGVIDEVEIRAGKTLLAREVGRTYPVAYNVSVIGEHAANYVAAEKVYINAEAYISPVTPYWTDLRDVNGKEAIIAPREYDGTVNAEFLLEEGEGNTALAMKGTSKSRITYDDLSLTLLSPHAGTAEGKIELANARLYDRYTPYISVGRALTAQISRKQITATATVYSCEQKTFDGTCSSDIEIYEFDFSDVEDLGDGFLAALTGGYAVSYVSAEYDGYSCGEHEITVSDISLLAFTRSEQILFDDYIIEEVTVPGIINPAEIVITTEIVRIYLRQGLPDIESNAEDPDILSATVYSSYDDAWNEVNPLPSTTSIYTVGRYWLRVNCLSDDYTLIGNTIIPLDITEAQDYKEQFIEVNAFNPYTSTEITPIAVPVGGIFAFDAISVTEDGENTGIPVTYSISDIATETEEGIFTAHRPGKFTVTLSAEGNAHYLPADDITVYFEAFTFSAEATSNLNDFYTGDILPSLYMDDANVTVNRLPAKGLLMPRDDEAVLFTGSHSYEYYFIPEFGYGIQKVDLSIKGVIYEEDGGSYLPTNDTLYENGKTYYIIESETVAFTPDDEILFPVYELDENGVYVPSTDLYFDEDKTYYTLEITEDTTATVTRDGFFTYDGTDYVPVFAGDKFLVTETYYICGSLFLGAVPLNLVLNAGKYTIDILLDGVIETPYGKPFDLKAAVNGISAEGESIPLSLVDIAEDVRIIKITRGASGATEEDVTASIFDIGLYTVGDDGGETVYVLRARHDEFIFNFSGFATFNVLKSEITVYAANSEKPYYTSEPDENALLGSLRVSGYYNPEDLDEIFENVNVSCSASRRAPAGEYVIAIDGIEETDNYKTTYRFGYVTVLPASITVNASSVGHVYGNDPTNINVTMTVYGSYSQEDISALESEVLPFITADAHVDENSDVGRYPIDMAFYGDVADFSVTFGDSYYEITPAYITGVSFLDSQVLYDGERHSIRITYDENDWPNLSVVYDNDYFVNKGVYEFTAVVSSNNYFDLTLRATLVISTLTVESSNLTDNSVTFSVSKESCPDGLSPDLVAALKAKDNEEVGYIVSKIREIKGDDKFKVLAAYDIGVTENGSNINLSASYYNLSFRTSSVQYSPDLKLYGYGEDGYGELEYSYQNGVYNVKVTSLQDLAFAVETVEKANPVFIWLAVGGIGLLIILVLSAIFGSGKRARREHLRSRRRHHRWA